MVRSGSSHSQWNGIFNFEFHYCIQSAFDLDEPYDFHARQKTFKFLRVLFRSFHAAGFYGERLFEQPSTLQIRSGSCSRSAVTTPDDRIDPHQWKSDTELDPDLETRGQQ